MVVSKGLSESFIASVLKQILKVLLYLKHKGIVHRDLKPENMLFDRNGKTLKIIDFGISVKREGEEVLSERVGTPYYVAPEVLLKSYDDRCDLWATGVIVFMMMTKKPPFKGENESDIMKSILTKEPLYTKSVYEKYSLECINLVK